MIAAGLWAAASSSAVGGGYLASEGPPPLRFASQLKAAIERSALPTLAMTTPDSSAPAPAPALTGDAVADSSAPEVHNGKTGTDSMASRSGADVGGNQVSERIDIPPAVLNPTWTAPAMAVTPQLLLGYFGSPVTNGVNSVVLAPLSFVPPQPGASGSPPSSRATYRKISP